MLPIGSRLHQVANLQNDDVLQPAWSSGASQFLAIYSLMKIWTDLQYILTTICNSDSVLGDRLGALPGAGDRAGGGMRPVLVSRIWMGSPTEQQADSPFHANQGPRQRDELVRQISMCLTPGSYLCLHLTGRSNGWSAPAFIVSCWERQLTRRMDKTFAAGTYKGWNAWMRGRQWLTRICARPGSVPNRRQACTQDSYSYLALRALENQPQTSLLPDAHCLAGSAEEERRKSLL